MKRLKIRRFSKKIRMFNINKLYSDNYFRNGIATIMGHKLARHKPGIYSVYRRVVFPVNYHYLILDNTLNYLSHYFQRGDYSGNLKNTKV